MITIKLEPSERALIEQRGDQYRVVGPGRVWLRPWQRVAAKFSIEAQNQSFLVKEVGTLEHIPVDITVQLLYQVNPGLLTADLWPRIPALQREGWRSALRWQTEHLLRQLAAGHTWSDLGREATQERLGQQLAAGLNEYLTEIALAVHRVCLVKIDLPAKLQQSLVQAQQDSVEGQGRAGVLREYLGLFGQELPEVMPHVIQWELMNMLHKNGHSHLMVNQNRPPQIELPVLPELREGNGIG